MIRKVKTKYRSRVLLRIDALEARASAGLLDDAEAAELARLKEGIANGPACFGIAANSGSPPLKRKNAAATYLKTCPTLSDQARAALNQPVRWDAQAELGAEIYQVAAAVRAARGVTLLED